MKTVKNYIYSSLYQLFLIIVPFVTIPYVSRVLGADLIGINSFTNTIMTYFVLFSNLGTTVYGNRTIAYSRDSVAKRSQKFWEIIILKLVVSSSIYLMFLVFIWIYPKYRVVFMIQSIQILAAAVDISWLFDGLEDFKRTVVRNFIVKLSSVIMIFLFVKTIHDFNMYVLITVGATLVGNLTLWTYLKQYITKVSFTKLNISDHFVPVFSLFVPQIASTIFVSLNKVLLGALSTMSQVGYFENSDKVVRILLALVSSIGVVVFPKVANAYKNRDVEKVTELTKLTFDAVNIITIPMGVGILSISDVFSNIFFGPEFVGIDIVLSILILELLFMGYSSVLGSQYLIATGQSKYLSFSVIGGIVTTSISSFILISRYGAIGAAVASVIGEATIAIIQIICIRKQINIFKLYKDIPKYSIASLLMFFGITLVKMMVSWSSYIDLFSRIIVGGLIYVGSLFLLRPQLIKFLLKKFFKETN
ncbi:oligosaccharide flippase family protein [Streptococcus thermophilus]|uniref:oligosaccharide flippase family protein n=1 Tax=Streptococcus thermophilus TaxID=1308 RepID=UPI0022FE29BA|nr:oligosaccharide flippase family protein [Streptococcus thermophilus]MDA5541696.1 oligosaccharide flippase family protein [Streptococcus thermophilus]